MDSESPTRRAEVLFPRSGMANAKCRPSEPWTALKCHKLSGRTSRPTKTVYVLDVCNVRRCERVSGRCP